MVAENRLENAYLKHILIAIEERDFSAPFRTFFDNWFAFREGGPFLNGNSRPHWFNRPCPSKYGEALRRAHFISAGALPVLSGLTSKRLMKDHAIPVAVLRDMLFEKRPNSAEEVRKLLLQYFRFGIITDEEDRRLNGAGLRSRMPNGWSESDDVFARYATVRIAGQNLRPSYPVLRKSIESFRVRPKARDVARKLLHSVAPVPFIEGGQNG